MLESFKVLANRLITLFVPQTQWLIWLMVITTPLAFIFLWFNPFWLGKVAAVLLVLLAVGGFWQWRQKKIADWLSSLLILGFFWYTSLGFWLFLENSVYRVIFLVVLTFFTWWYLNSWRSLTHNLLGGERGAGSAATLAVGLLAVFMAATTGASVLVYLDIAWWKLVLIYSVMIGSVLWSEIYAIGWSWATHWSYWLMSTILSIEVFMVGLWLPTSFYVIGFTMSCVHLVNVLVWRQEAQGFLNKRLLSREVAWIMLILLAVLITARWT